MSETNELQPVRFATEQGTPVRHRHHYTYLNDDGDREYWETWVQREFPHDSSDKYHFVEAGMEGYRGITLLSYQYYGRVDLWFVIALANGIFHPTTELVAGMELRIPDRSRVLAILL